MHNDASGNGIWKIPRFILCVNISIYHSLSNNIHSTWENRTSELIMHEIISHINVKSFTPMNTMHFNVIENFLLYITIKVFLFEFDISISLFFISIFFCMNRINFKSSIISIHAMCSILWKLNCCLVEKDEFCDKQITCVWITNFSVCLFQ